MMDLKQEFFRNFELSLLPYFKPDQIQNISNSLTVALEEYDLVKKSKELVVYDTTNDIILKNYYGCLIISGKSEKTAKQYIGELRRFINFKGKKLTEITAQDLKDYLAYLLAYKKVSKTTANNSKNYLSSFFKWLNEEGYVAANPATTLKAVKQEKKIKEVFTEVELDRMRRLDLNLRDKALIDFMLSTGVRVEELCALNIEDVDFKNLNVFIRGGKGGKDRVVFMSSVASYHLQNYLNSRKDNYDALFLNHPNLSPEHQKRITDGGIRYVLRQIGKTLNIEKCHPHKFRRTLATLLYKKGMDVHEIQQILGHEDISVTTGYIVTDNTLTKQTYNKFMG